MRCPFCKEMIPHGVLPMKHMQRCQQEQAKLWDSRFRLAEWKTNADNDQ